MFAMVFETADRDVRDHPRHRHPHVRRCARVERCDLGSTWCRRSSRPCTTGCRWPPSVEAIGSILYFDGDVVAEHLQVLGLWGLVSLASGVPHRRHPAAAHGARLRQPAPRETRKQEAAAQGGSPPCARVGAAPRRVGIRDRAGLDRRGHRGSRSASGSRRVGLEVVLARTTQSPDRGRRPETPHLRRRPAVGTTRTPRSPPPSDLETICYLTSGLMRTSTRQSQGRRSV
jgi:hypothetical protein